MLVPRLVVPVDVKAPRTPDATVAPGGSQQNAGAPRLMLVPRILVPGDVKAAAPGSAAGTPQYRRTSESTPAPRGWQQAAGAPRPPLLPRILVPVDAKLALLERAAGTAQHSGAPEAVAVRVSQQGQPVLVLRPALFVQAMLENSPTKPRSRAKDLVVSLTAHGLLLAVFFLVPLYFTEAIDLHQFNRTLLVAPLPPAPPPPLAPAAVVQSRPAPRKLLPVAGKLVAPRVIPKEIARLREEPSATDLAAAIGPGVPGGVPGGQPGGVIGGILTGDSAGSIPPPPTPSGPKSPIRVGGDVKAPRLISQVAPAYPLVLRKARVSGDVVIDAVIDTQGNVMEMHSVSGNPLLIPAAMDALRRWKYEPTILNGQAYPVKLLVTITFRLG